MQKVLILGGSGLVGTAVAGEMERGGIWEVSPTYCRNPIPNGVPFSVDRPDSIRAVLDEIRPDIVISCLRGDFDKQLRAHVAAAEYLNARGGRLYFFSTTNVFDNDMSRPHDEDDAPDSQTEYGQFKIECERRMSDILGNRACILRIPQVWGRDSLRLKQLRQSLCDNEEIEVYPYLSINTNTDVMIALQSRYIIEHDLQGTFHLASEDVINYKELYLTLAKGLGFPAANIREDDGEEGCLALFTKRSGEFPERLRITNQRVIEYLIG